MVLASSHLLLVTNGEVIGGACEFTYVVSNSWSSNLTTDVNCRAPSSTAPLVTKNRCELASTTNYCSISY
jgi:hypothetical protein